MALSRLWGRYLHTLKKHPLRTQALTTCTIMGAGDFLSQTLVERRRPSTYDSPRTGRFLGLGLCVFGPGMHVWYSYLDRVIKGSLVSRVVKKTFLDQAFFMPAYLGVFIILMAALRGENDKQIKEKLKKDYPPMLAVSYAIWPAVQVVNFAWIPGHHRVLVINLVCLVWNTYLAWKDNKQDKNEGSSKSLPQVPKIMETPKSVPMPEL